VLMRPFAGMDAWGDTAGSIGGESIPLMR